MTQLVFDDFLHLLRRNGFKAGLPQYLRLHDLLARLGGEVAPGDLKFLLCPLFATNAFEQQAFYRLFEAHFAFGATGDEANRPAGPMVNGRGRLLRVSHRTLLFGAACLAFVVAPGPPLNLERTSAPAAAGPAGARGSEGVVDSQRTLGDLRDELREKEQRLDQPSVGPVTVRQDGEVPAAWSDRITRLLLKYGGAAAAGLPVILLFILEAYLLTHRRAVVRRSSRAGPPYHWPLQAATVPVPGLAPDMLLGTSRLLMQRRVTNFYAPDIERTIAATIESGGYPRLQFKAASEPPEYLVLIERLSPRDHLARLTENLVAALQNEGVFCSVFHFDSDPRLCFDSRGIARPLAELAARYSRHRMLVFGACESLIDPVSGELASWTAVFSEWAQRAILTPREPHSWGEAERHLASQFVLGTSSLGALGEVVRRFARPAAPAEGMRLDGNPFGEITTAEDALLTEWICACALYPELHWEMTVRLGQALSSGKSLLSEENLLRLARIPWFRSGSIPDEMRLGLIAKLSPEAEARARRVIVDLLEQSRPPAGSIAARAHEVDLLVQKALLAGTEPEEREDLMRQLRGHTPTELRREGALLEVVNLRKASPLDFVLPRKLAASLWSGDRIGRRLIAGLLAFVLWFGTDAWLNSRAVEPAYLVINASPWGRVQSVRGEEGGERVAATMYTPLRFEVPAGRYTVVIVGPDGESVRSGTIDARKGQTLITAVFRTIGTDEYLRSLEVPVNR